MRKINILIENIFVQKLETKLFVFESCSSVKNYTLEDQ